VILLVRIGRLDDLDDIMEMLNLCKLDMKKRKLNIWNDDYPNQRIILDDLKSNGAVVYENEEGKVVAFLVMYPKHPDAQEEIFKDHDNYCLIQRVMVHPLYRRHGYAQQILDFVEKQGFTSIRLLTRNTNTYSVNLYTKLGYQVVKTQRKDDEIMQTCEKKLKVEK
jgi:ribosomal protein S18 acetylase RimI-like enzyme